MQRTYSLLEIINLRDSVTNIRDIGCCDVLVDEIYKVLFPNKTFEEVLLIEEYNGDFGDEYIRYVMDAINNELITNGVAFIELANSSGEDKTIFHRFILFNTSSGIVRLESYSRQIIYEYISSGAIKKRGYTLYEPRIVEWPTCFNDLTILLKLKHGKERISYWNGLFSSIEEHDTNEFIDVVLLK